ncbi:transposon-encoded TnpW family protein [Anaerovorax odorimutans]|uniref:transposon-encoded TnpW family protein n=1 Tax=Anaerovorax odorimutans TaxID=109327 RepID=UPI00146F9395
MHPFSLYGKRHITETNPHPNGVSKHPPLCYVIGGVKYLVTTYFKEDSTLSAEDKIARLIEHYIESAENIDQNVWMRKTILSIKVKLLMHIFNHLKMQFFTHYLAALSYYHF